MLRNLFTSPPARTQGLPEGEPFYLLWFDIAARVHGLLVFLFVFAQALPEGSDASAEFTGNFANAPGTGVADHKVI